MKLIKPSFEIWEQKYDNPIEDMYKHIARCTRVCYQSEKKNNDETDEEFVKRVILRKEPWSSEANHLAMLEHGTVNLYCLEKPFNRPLIKYSQNKYSKYNFENLGNGKFHSYVTTNLRVLVENDWLDDLKYICAPTSYHSRRVTVSFITNIGVSREFNRHRVNSMAEESTRYCNYSLGKFDNEITFVKPAWFNRLVGLTLTGKYIPIDNKGDFTQEEEKFIRSLSDAERSYIYLINCGWKPQQAREVLPLATKTQLIHTAFINDWKHFFKLRAEGVSGSPHPNAALLAVPLFEEFKKRNYV